MIKIVVCDDNVKEQQEYIKKLEQLKTTIDVPVEIIPYKNGKQMLFELETPKNIPEIIYLDINMPDISGIDVAGELRNRNFKGEIVFLTRSDKHWQSAFDLRAFNYIVKDDCSEKRFSDIFHSLTSIVLEKNSEYMLFSSCGEVVTVAMNTIQYFEVIRNVVTVHYTGSKFEFYSTLGKLEEQLAGRGFVRIHKSYLISIYQISRFTFNEVLLKDNTRLPVGRMYYKSLKETVSERSAAIHGA